MSDHADMLDLPSLTLKPWQRLAASMHVTGTPIQDIAPHIGQPVEIVSHFITSKQGAVIMGKLITENQLRLQDLLDAAAVDSLLVLIKLRDNPKTSDAVKVSACKELLSRTLPSVKAKEGTVKEGSAHSQDPQDEIERLRGVLSSI